MKLNLKKIQEKISQGESFANILYGYTDEELAIFIRYFSQAIKGTHENTSANEQEFKAILDYLLASDIDDLHHLYDKIQKNSAASSDDAFLIFLNKYLKFMEENSDQNIQLVFLPPEKSHQEPAIQSSLDAAIFPNIIKFNDKYFLVAFDASPDEKRNSILDFLNKELDKKDAEEIIRRLITPSHPLMAQPKEQLSLFQSTVEITRNHEKDNTLHATRYDVEVSFDHKGNLNPKICAINGVSIPCTTIHTNSLALFFDHIKEEETFNSNLLDSIPDLSVENKQDLRNIFVDIKSQSIKVLIINFGNTSFLSGSNLPSGIPLNLKNILLSCQLFYLIKKLRATTLSDFYYKISSAIKLLDIDISETKLDLLNELDPGFLKKLPIVLSSDEIYTHGVNLFIFRENKEFLPSYELVGHHIDSDRQYLLNEYKSVNHSSKNFVENIIKLIQKINDEDRKSRFVNTLLDMVIASDIPLDFLSNVSLIKNLLVMDVSFIYKKSLRLFQEEQLKQEALKIIFKEVPKQNIPDLYKEENRNYKLKHIKNQAEFELYLQNLFFDEMPISCRVNKYIEIYCSLYSPTGINYHLESMQKEQVVCYLENDILARLSTQRDVEKTSESTVDIETIKAFSEVFSKKTKKYSIENKKAILPFFFRLLSKLNIIETTPLAGAYYYTPEIGKFTTLKLDFGFSDCDPEIYDSIYNFILSNRYFSNESFEEIVKNLIDQPILPPQDKRIESFKKRFLDTIANNGNPGFPHIKLISPHGYEITPKHEVDIVETNNEFDNCIQFELQEYIAQKFNWKSLHDFALVVSSPPSIRNIYSYKQKIIINFVNFSEARIEIKLNIYDDKNNHIGLVIVKFDVNLQFTPQQNEERETSDFTISNYEFSSSYSSETLKNIAHGNYSREIIKHVLGSNYNSYIAVLKIVANKYTQDDSFKTKLPDNYYELFNLSIEIFNLLSPEDIDYLFDLSEKDSRINIRQLVKDTFANKNDKIPLKKWIVIAKRAEDIIKNLFGNRFYIIIPKELEDTLIEILLNAINSSDEKEKNQLLNLFDKVALNKENHFELIDSVQRVKLVALLRNHFPEKLLFLEKKKMLTLTSGEIAEFVCHYPDKKFVKEHILSDSYLRGKFNPNEVEDTQYVISMVRTFLARISGISSRNLTDHTENSIRDLINNFGIFCIKFFNWFSENSDKENLDLLGEEDKCSNQDEDAFKLNKEKTNFDIQVARLISGQHNLPKVMQAYKDDSKNKELNANILLNILENCNLSVSYPDYIQLFFTMMDQTKHFLRLLNIFKENIKLMSIDVINNINQNIADIILNPEFSIEDRRSLLDSWLLILSERKEADFELSDSKYLTESSQYEAFQDIIEKYVCIFSKRKIAQQDGLLNLISSVGDPNLKNKLCSALLQITPKTTATDSHPKQPFSRWGLHNLFSFRKKQETPVAASLNNSLPVRK